MSFYIPEQSNDYQNRIEECEVEKIMNLLNGTKPDIRRHMWEYYNMDLDFNEYIKTLTEEDIQKYLEKCRDIQREEYTKKQKRCTEELENINNELNNINTSDNFTLPDVEKMKNLKRVLDLSNYWKDYKTKIDYLLNI